jgi:hypothetical protein
MTNEQRQKLDRMTDDIVQNMSDRRILNDTVAEQVGNRILQTIEPGLVVGRMQKRSGGFSSHRFYVCEIKSTDDSGLNGAEMTLELNRDKLLVEAWIRK